MRLTRSRALAVSTTAIAAMLVAGAPSASAQNLFERLFGNRERRVEREAPPPVVQQAPARPAPPRVTGPQYYTYKTEALVRIDFAAIKPARLDEEAALGATGIDTESVGSTVAVSEAMPSEGVEEIGANAETGGEVSENLPDAESAAGREPANDATSQATGLPRVEDAQPIGEAAPQQPVSVPRVEDAQLIGQGTATAATPKAEETQPLEQAFEAPASQPLTDAEIASLQQVELLAEKEAADAIVAHYTAVPEFIWVSDGRPNERARAALRTLGDAGSHALEPHDYAVSVPATDADDAALAAFEMELSARMLRYIRDARSGRVDPNRISGYHDFAPKELDAVAALQLARTADEVSAYLEAQHPQNVRYNALRVELEMLRAAEENDIVIAPNTVVRPGETNPEFSKILTLIGQRADEAFRAEYGDVLTRHLGSEAYAQELAPVIKAAQKLAGVGADGVIGPRTIRALAGETRASRIEKTEVALEQARWLPSDLTDRHVFINTPAFKATYVEDGKEKLSMRTVVGSTRTQTYFFQDKIQYVEFHPYWGVPRSILVNKYLPKLYADSSYLDRNGFEVVDRRGRTVPSSSVNWSQYGANVPFDVRQRPGRSNALGELKIMFPNRHAIYMHDTPEKQLFDRDNRAVSNGCIRLADPRGMAAAVLGWERTRVDARLEQPHSRQNLDVEVPVYVGYFTAWPDEAGKVHYYEDVYGRDDKTRAAIEKVDALRAPGA
ncbi:MAG: L,D-transpeptidase family protein [Aquamicrobium sp.]|nr:L,D-transpeptidase family protein [Aquamicrobium sp.]